MHEEIFNAVKVALAELGAHDLDFVVERPSDFSHGDYATNAALVAAKKLGQKPIDVAKTLQEKMLSQRSSDLLASGSARPFAQVFSPSTIDKIEIAGPGFINFFLSHKKIQEVVEAAATNDMWGKSELYKDKKIMVEYTQPNPFKEFHIGHLMSNALGESIARTLEAAGAKVIRANYQGDVGPHVAKAMHVLLEQGHAEPTLAEISAAYVEGSRRYEEDPSEKTAIDQLNKLIYQQYESVTDEKAWALYQYGRTVTLAHFEELYRMLGTKFDFYFFESETGARGLAMIRSHIHVFEESDGAIIFRGDAHGLHTRVFVNSLGLPTYEAKDLGLAELKKERANFDLSITVTAKEQDEYFKVVFKALENIHPDWVGQFKHVSHGMMRFASGKMSSRKGNVITGELLLMDLKEEVKSKMGERELADRDKTAEQVAVGAIKYTVLKQGSGKDIVFDPEQSLSLEGDSGPYLQYALVRARSVLKKVTPESVMKAVPEEGYWLNLARLLVHYPDVVERAVTEMEPHYITTYLTELAGAFNSLYGVERFIVDGKILNLYYRLVQAFEKTMISGLMMLGIPAPEEM